MKTDQAADHRASHGARSLATRETLVDLASELFAEHGYIQTSIRDIARRGSLTSGAIYGHFRNKADLLAEAINVRTQQDLDTDALLPGVESSHVERLRRQSRAYPARRRLRALIIQGAAAAVTDTETRTRVRDEQLTHIDDWIARYEEHREALGIDPSVDIPSAVLYTWAAELGLGVLEAFGMEPASRDGWADMAARVGRAMRLPPEPADVQAKSRPRARKVGRAKGA